MAFIPLSTPGERKSTNPGQQMIGHAVEPRAIRSQSYRGVGAPFPTRPIVKPALTAVPDVPRSRGAQRIDPGRRMDRPRPPRLEELGFGRLRDYGHRGLREQPAELIRQSFARPAASNS
jgi:hypothetical protein